METHNQQARADAIWRFAAIAALPALLLFFGGFSMGGVFKTHAGDAVKKYEEAAAIAGSLQEKIRLEQLFFQKSDSLMNLLVVKTDALYEQLKELGKDPALDLDIINRVRSEQSNLEVDFNLALKKLEAEFPPSDSADVVVTTGRKYFRKFLAHNADRITKRVREAQAIGSQGELGEVQELREEIEAEKEKMKQEAAGLAMQAEKDDLQRQFNQCEKDLAKCQQPASSGGGGKEKDYSKEVGKILGEVEAIKKEVIPKMPTGLLGKKKGLKEELRGYLDAIASAAKEIK